LGELDLIKDNPFANEKWDVHYQFCCMDCKRTLTTKTRKEARKVGWYLSYKANIVLCNMCRYKEVK